MQDNQYRPSYLLALDQSSRVTGWSIFDLSTKELIKTGKWSIPGEDKLSMQERLMAFWENLSDVYMAYPIEQIVYEDIQLQRGNVKTFKTLSYIQATILLWCGDDYSFNPTCISPSHWRSVLKDEYGIEWGRKRADQKAAAQKFAKEQTGKDFTEDEADSYCIGLAYLTEEGKATCAF